MKEQHIENIENCPFCKKQPFIVYPKPESSNLHHVGCACIPGMCIYAESYMRTPDETRKRAIQIWNNYCERVNKFKEGAKR